MFEELDAVLDDIPEDALDEVLEEFESFIVDVGAGTGAGVRGEVVVAVDVDVVVVLEFFTIITLLLFFFCKAFKNAL